MKEKLYICVNKESANKKDDHIHDIEGCTPHPHSDDNIDSEKIVNIDQFADAIANHFMSFRDAHDLEAIGDGTYRIIQNVVKQESLLKQCALNDFAQKQLSEIFGSLSLERASNRILPYVLVKLDGGTLTAEEEMEYQDLKSKLVQCENICKERRAIEAEFFSLTDAGEIKQYDISKRNPRWKSLLK